MSFKATEDPPTSGEEGVKGSFEAVKGIYMASIVFRVKYMLWPLKKYLYGYFFKARAYTISVHGPYGFLEGVGWFRVSSESRVSTSRAPKGDSCNYPQQPKSRSKTTYNTYEFWSSFAQLRFQVRGSKHLNIADRKRDWCMHSL